MGKTDVTYCVQDVLAALDNVDRNLLTANFWIVLHDILLAKVVNLGSSFHTRGSTPTNDEAQKAPSVLRCCGG